MAAVASVANPWRYTDGDGMRRVVAVLAVVGVALFCLGVRLPDHVVVGSAAVWAALVGGLVGFGLGAGWARAERGWTDWRSAVELMRFRRRAMPGLVGTVLGWGVVVVVIAGLAVLIAGGRH